ncbi:MAG TPA: sterol desaturase family protein [Thermohalobaculum sp.]|nr:sterol desaturase family protein [Thermohalobaculum sp.]
MDNLSRTRFALALLALLFLAQVAGQAAARLYAPPMLPPDSLWHAGVMPYALLAGTQLAMFAAMALVVWRINRIGVRPLLAALILGTGTVYFGLMSARFVIGAAGVAPGGWFDKPISTPFHLVLAGWLLIYGFHLSGEKLRGRLRWVVRAVSRMVAYPVVMLAVCALFLWLRRNGAPIQFAAYLPVILGASAILILELAAPYRREWLPGRQVITQDALYLLVVQVALPAALTLVIVGAAAVVFENSLAAGLWPHDWPLPVQAALMVIVADFMRYWLHRASHRWNALWRLHAVHHSSEELYFLNVGRFHPLEKSLQFLFDAAPFILIGVGPEVISAYYVFYAVNGFFQHSNVDVRLGPMNWLIAGPELHRWHHSRIVRESNTNFGNNLILWDVLFGTRFLPPRQVGDLGLQNPAYPKDFIGQTLAPLTVDPNRDAGGSSAA